VVGIHGPDYRLVAVVEGRETVVEGITGLVNRIIACDPGVVLVVFCNLAPEPDGAVLVVFVVPEGGVGGGVVGVPVRVLAAGDSMHIEDCVDVVFGALWDVRLTFSEKVEGAGVCTNSITRSRCLNPDSFSTRGFMSSSKCR
jgi:hypothetical protein